MTVTLENNRIHMNGDDIGVFELDRLKEAMAAMGCNPHYQALKKPSLRVYAALVDTIRKRDGITARSMAGTYIY